MPDGCKQILLLLGVKNEKLRISKIYVGKKKTKFSWNRQGIILQIRMVRRIFRQ